MTFKPGLASALRVDDAALAQEAALRPEWLREEEELNAFEAIGMSAASVGLVVDFHDNYDKAEHDVDLMIREEQGRA